MFFRKKSPPQDPQGSEEVRDERFNEIPWDAKTVSWLKEQNRFDVKITHANRTTGFGSQDKGVPQIREPWQFYGLMLNPKYVQVDITFSQGKKFGFFHYSWTKQQRVTVIFDGKPKWVDVKIPILNINLSDEEELPRVAFEAHRDALMSGKTHSQLRIFKNAGDGELTNKDKEVGYSYESRYDVVGCIIWNELQSVKLPNWALNVHELNFSLDQMPQHLWHEDPMSV